MGQSNHALAHSTTVAGERVRRVLVVAPGTSPATQMIYALPFQTLAGTGFSWRIVPEYHLNVDDLKDIHLLILYRCIQGSSLTWLRYARLKQIKVIYELDDDLLEPPEDEVWGKRYRLSRLSEIIRNFLAEADLVKAGSPELAKRLQAKGYPAIYQPYAAKNMTSFKERMAEPPYRVGYFGSPHHLPDIEMIVPALQHIKDALQDQIQLEFIGCYPRQWQQLGAKIYPFETDYDAFLECLTNRQWSLGLVPLRKTAFNAAKSNSKFRELTAAGVLGIYSHLAPYQGSVINGDTGWFAGDSPQEWQATILNALRCPKRPEMLQRARTLLLKDHHPQMVAKNWISLIP